jgi:hypothetical protein
MRRRPAEGESKRGFSLGNIRDTVEIVAIVAAGCWAFFTFVYEDRIKPANAQPEPIYDCTLTRLGERAGLIAVRSHILIKNAGTTALTVYGFAESVVGLNVRATRAATAAGRTAGKTDFESRTDFREETQRPVFAIAFLTQLADPRATSNFNLTPGQSFPIDRIFYVAAGRYDELRVHLSLRFGTTQTPIAFALKDRAGIVELDQRAPGDVSGIEETATALSLW